MGEKRKRRFLHTDFFWIDTKYGQKELKDTRYGQENNEIYIKVILRFIAIT